MDAVAVAMMMTRMIANRKMGAGDFMLGMLYVVCESSFAPRSGSPGCRCTFVFYIIVSKSKFISYNNSYTSTLVLLQL